MLSMFKTDETTNVKIKANLNILSKIKIYKIIQN
jgi:hypothetical protein